MADKSSVFPREQDNKSRPIFASYCKIPLYSGFELYIDILLRPKR